MITDVINIVDAAVRLAISGKTTNIFFYELPNEELLEKFTVTYEVNNSQNDGVFTNPELITHYDVQVKLNSKKRAEVLSNSIYIRNGFKNLIASNVKTVELGNEQFFWDNELKVYTNNLNYKIQY